MKLFYIDLEQAESRTVGAILYTLFGDETYLNACESGDLHTLVCAMCWTSLDWPAGFGLQALPSGGGKIPPNLLHRARKVADQTAYREMTYRDLAKRLGHGTNYFGKPPQMAKHTHVQKDVIIHFQRAYFRAFPFISEWHRKCAERIQVDRQITTLLGRRRWFFGRPDADTTLREAIAFEPQSVATGDYMNLGLYNVWRENWPVHLFSQVHDAVAGCYDERDEHWLIPAICSKLETELILTAPDQRTRKFSIPTEPAVGWNLSYCSDSNPDGLKKWKGSDDRERSFGPTRKISDIQLAEL